ncbi:hypothetical protein NL108_014298, partial [Boleophthalmus pectinirostris]
VQSQQRHVGYFHHFEPDSGNISHSVTLTTESCDQNLIVLLQQAHRNKISQTNLNEVEAAVIGHKSSDFLSVFDELDPHTLPDGRRNGLSFYFNSDGNAVDLLHFLKDDALGVRGSSEGVSLQSSAQVSLLVLFIVPFLLTTVVTELTSRTQSTTLS